MKKWLVIGLVLVGCSVVQSSNTNETPTLQSNGYLFEDIELEGMNYRVYYMDYKSTQTGYCLGIINITKDKLECQLMKQQLRKGREG